ncbi:efflux transporter outer membrane subunit [Corticibacter populi]|uniref:Efflux transporter outer membrane subunit n=1 Tax=Corticibacter populi TaxID=1550736 RepID=A0A3M6QXT6_9BURK|nr:efflux transporter outer membrane subunit [Corticibacter populi]RMX07721.1 efflux transporter outer membrane subunit [Corticibacter populi]RZS30237.1 multidrug efflux system outer membrane protein [Corticibacter populi]
MRRKQTLLSTSLALVLAGCASLAPDYERPAAPVPQQWSTPAGSSASATAVEWQLPDWREVFIDARLQQVIATALAHNRDLRVALLNIEQARAQYRIQDAAQWPTVNAAGGQSAARSASGTTSRNYSAEVGLSSWELDLFGRVRSLRDQALQSYLATAETQRSTRLSLIAEVASQWLNVAAYQQQLALARQTLQSQQRSLALTQLRHDEGMVSGVDLASMQASVETARADVASYDTTLAQARNALDLLVGAPIPEALLPAPEQPLADLVALAPLPARLDSSVLLQRPDVLAAEYELQAANANIGAARAAFFPSFSLTTSAGVGSSTLSDLFNGASRIWSFVPNITVPIFSAGALQAELDVATLSRDITVAEYEKAIQTAFSEVADALDERARIDARLDAQRALVVATARSHTLADARWREGVDSSLEALTAQRNLYSAEQGLISLALTEATNRVMLYKVLGGEATGEASGEPLTARTTTTGDAGR